MNKQHFLHQLIDSFHTTQSEVEEVYEQEELAKISVIEYGFSNGSLEGGGSATYMPQKDQFSLWMHYTIEGLDMDITHEISEKGETVSFENIGSYAASVMFTSDSTTVTIVDHDDQNVATLKRLHSQALFAPE